ncbi:hypothetical protein GFS31_26930 [Leptolyngbya sp. BL0902]|uniref:hypothetical protein n=1 Tax=Leptolyngbya sp. BL0902 TaxID=1115757 RepID=UPI0018E7284B|nr:hypothetical protein [Leptolyngbya sp. BL0902]QQE65998.1 hypothetical protein GFS31_26930 [Leptolyngbya sp. BL0902]
MVPAPSNADMAPAQPSIAVAVTLLEVYEAPVPPPGSSGVYPASHAVVRLRLENLTPDPVAVAAGELSLRTVTTDEDLLITTVEPITLEGLQVVEQGFHLTGEDLLGRPGDVRAVYDFAIGDQPQQAMSETVSFGEE